MDIKTLSRLIRVGRVSSVNESTMSVRVIFTDMEDTVSHELPVISQGSLNRKHYWLPDIDEQVLCIMMPNTSGKGANDGFVIGTFFNAKDTPGTTGLDIRRVDFGDGSYVEHNRSTGDMAIHAVGNITITGKTVNIN